MYYLITILLLFLVVVMAVKSLSRRHQHDSALKRRAVLTSHEQMTLTRLQTVLPKFTVLAHVSFDALLTTKYAHTRRKYQNMSADFVVLDQNYQVVVVVVLGKTVYAEPINNTSVVYYNWLAIVCFIIVVCLIIMT